jgi:hypothetical protein
MPLRSGKEYLVPHRCQKCIKYYSNEKFGFLCSVCSPDFHRDVPNYAEREAKLETWVEERTVEDKRIISIVKKAATHSDGLLLSILKRIRLGGLLLRSKVALELLGGVRRGHVITPFVCDWWNIRTDMGWPSYLVCYYGNFDNKNLPPYPPRCSNPMLYCTETRNYFSDIYI